MRGQIRGILAIMWLLLFTVPKTDMLLGAPAMQEGNDSALGYMGCGGVFDIPFSNPAYEQTVVEMVNAVRAEQVPPLPPLKRVAALDDAARYHSMDMAVDDYFDHDSFDRVDGNLVFACNTWERITTYYLNWLNFSENLAAGYCSPEAVMAEWISSPGHRDNILWTSSWEIGVGYYQGGAYGHYWTQNFGRRNGVYPIVINREDDTTDDYHVNLYIYGSGTWPEMRLRNNDAAWGDWRPFQPELPWELPMVAGEHTVWVELRNGTQTTTSSDSIDLNWTQPIATLSIVPATVTFEYDAVTGSLTPPSHTINLTNATSEDTIVWSLTTEGDWFSATPAGGTTPGAFTIAPTTFMTQPSATYTGAVTVTATDPPDTADAVQRIAVTLDVRVPALGNLPDAITFTYSIPSEQLIPSAWTLTPRNVGSDHPLQWSVTGDAPWMQIVPQGGTTPQSFTVTPVGFLTSSAFLYTGMLAITVDGPAGVAGSPHQVQVALEVLDEEFSYVYLPLVYRNF